MNASRRKNASRNNGDDDGSEVSRSPFPVESDAVSPDPVEDPEVVDETEGDPEDAADASSEPASEPVEAPEAEEDPAPQEAAEAVTEAPSDLVEASGEEEPRRVYDTGAVLEVEQGALAPTDRGTADGVVNSSGVKHHPASVTDGIYKF